jgi:polyisoprenoid-binding protein YceI
MVTGFAKEVPMRSSLVTAALFVLALAPAAQAQTWTIDSSHSAAQFAVKHMMISTVRGDMGKVTGTVTYDGKNLAAATVEASVDVTGINTREEKRDAHLKSADFFDVAKFPAITFKSKKVIPGTNGAFKVVGDLTMHGVTKEVTLDVEALRPVVKMWGANHTGTTATTTINRSAFGMTFNSALETGGVMVSDEVTITIDLELQGK